MLPAKRLLMQHLQGTWCVELLGTSLAVRMERGWLGGLTELARPSGGGLAVSVRGLTPGQTRPFDFGSSPILRTLADGRDILTVGQKSGIAWALDPDRRGRVLWQLRVGKGSAGGGGVQFGPAAADESAYFATADAFAGRDAGGLTAVGLSTGELRWSTRPPCPQEGPCSPARPAADQGRPLRRQDVGFSS